MEHYTAVHDFLVLISKGLGGRCFYFWTCYYSHRLVSKITLKCFFLKQYVERSPTLFR